MTILMTKIGELRGLLKTSSANAMDFGLGGAGIGAALSTPTAISLLADHGMDGARGALATSAIGTLAGGVSGAGLYGAMSLLGLDPTIGNSALTSGGIGALYGSLLGFGASPDIGTALKAAVVSGALGGVSGAISGGATGGAAWLSDNFDLAEHLGLE